MRGTNALPAKHQLACHGVVGAAGLHRLFNTYSMWPQWIAEHKTNVLPSLPSRRCGSTDARTVWCLSSGSWSVYNSAFVRCVVCSVDCTPHRYQWVLPHPGAMSCAHTCHDCLRTHVSAASGSVGEQASRARRVLRW